MLLTNIEFFTHEEEVWFRESDNCVRLSESNTDIIDGMIDIISSFYPKAYDALCKVYNGAALNKRYYRFRIVSRFIRCNFAQLDNTPDLSREGRCVFEYVPCPLRGECPLDHVVCRPEFNHKLSAAELPVMHLWFEGYDKEEIANKLFLSQHTVNNHIRHAYQRLAVHNRAEFVRYATLNNLFT